MKIKESLVILFVVMQFICRAEYDSTYVLSVTQKYAIPENVSNNDYVGIWQKTLTWRSSGTIGFAIHQNFNNAFSINSSTGLITISDATKINGKIVQQDTTINLIIRTTDAGIGYEDDTCKIRVKENAYCVFVDYNYSGTESGSRTQPFNDLDDVAWTTGKMVCVKRGNVINGETTRLHSLVSSAAHPLIICAWGEGNKPRFQSGPDICFNMETTGSTEMSERNEYLYFYDICIRNYDDPAYKVRRLCDHMGWYNCETYNCDKKDIESAFILNTSSYADSVKAYDFELINYYADTTSWNVVLGSDYDGPSPGNGRSGCYTEPSHIKSGVGMNIINSYFGKTPGGSVRFGSGVASFLPGNTIKHSVIHSQWAPSGNVNGYTSALQIRSDNFTVEDCRITSPTVFGIASAAAGCGFGRCEYEMTPDNLTVKNSYIANNTRSGIIIADGGEGWKAAHNVIIEDNDINCTNGIELAKEINTIIRRNKIHNGTGNGIKTAISSAGLAIYYNVIYGYTTAINLQVGTGAAIYNNTIVGEINCTGAAMETVRNNYFKSVISAATQSNNLDIDTITTADHFQNYTGHDYRLKSTALSAIDRAYNVGLKSDICGTSVPKGNHPDIGAYENETGMTEDPPVGDTDPPVGDTDSPIDEPEQKTVRMFPNPSQGIVSIRIDGPLQDADKAALLRVFDLQGRLFIQKPCYSILEGQQMDIDLSYFPKGLYIVRLGDLLNEKLLLQ